MVEHFMGMEGHNRPLHTVQVCPHKDRSHCKRDSERSTKKRERANHVQWSVSHIVGQVWVDKIVLQEGGHNICVAGTGSVVQRCRRKNKIIDIQHA